MTDLVFLTIPTMSLYLHYSDIDINRFGEENTTEDGAQVGVLSDVIQIRLSIVEWRQHQKNVILLLEDIKFRGVYIDCITQFSVQPLELISLFNSDSDYYWWFYIGTKEYNESCRCLCDFSGYLIDCSWIDRLQNQVKSIRKVFPEMLEYLGKVDDAISDSDSDRDREK